LDDKANRVVYSVYNIMVGNKPLLLLLSWIY